MTGQLVSKELPVCFEKARLKLAQNASKAGNRTRHHSFRPLHGPFRLAWAGAADRESGTATFKFRFESFQAIRNIKAEHKERAQRELVEERAAEAADVANKLRASQFASRIRYG